MQRFRLLVLGTLLLFGFAVSAQQKAAESASDDHDQEQAQQSVPSPETQMKILAEKLDLTADQQAKLKPILQDLHDFTIKLVNDKSLTQEERLAKVRPARLKAHQQILGVLNDEQRNKLDEYLKTHHHEMHGDLSGSKPAR